jgi:hypothetical protein
MFEGFTVTDWTAGSLLAAAVLLIFLGRLIPRPTYIEKVNEAERWRLAYETERDAHSITRGQNTELLENSKVTRHILEAMFTAVDTDPPGKGGAHRVVQTSK